MFNDIPSPTDVLHREAAFRLKVLEDFRVLEKRLRTQEERITELTDELARRNTYIHELHLKAEASAKEISSARSDVEHFVFRLSETTDRAEKAEQRLKWWENSLIGLLVRPLVALERALHPVPRKSKVKLLAGDAFHYHLIPSPYRVHREEQFTLSGWVALQDGRVVEAVRARVDDRVFDATVVTGSQSDAVDKPGAFEFTVTAAIPEGHHILQLEARWRGASEWRSFLNAPVWRVS